MAMAPTRHILTTTMAAAAPTETLLRKTCLREHPACFACRPANEGGLGLRFSVRADGSVGSEWTGRTCDQSYPGIVHGGLVTTLLDSAMAHALFARGVAARTGGLCVRFRSPLAVGRVATVQAWLQEDRAPLFRLAAELRQDGVLCARAEAKFMAGSAASGVPAGPCP